MTTTTDPTRFCITGAGSGIGRAIALRLAAPHTQLALLGRDPERLRATVDAVERRGGHALAFPVDIRAAAQVETAIAAVITALGDIEVLVNNAGIGGGGETRTEPDTQWEAILQTNLTGTYYVTKRVLQQSRMLERRWGRIINIASTGGKQGVIFAAAYTAAKHGVVGLTKSLGLELAKTGVTVNAVCPGFVETPLAERVRTHYAELYDITPEVMRQRIEARVPIGRYVDPDEVAAVVAFLATPAAQPITAQAWNVCGGLGNY